jgi:RNA polymerase sigma-70 factor (ECF subfamily)
MAGGRSDLLLMMTASQRSLRTSPSLLVRLRDDGDREAWSYFVEVYGPLVHGFLRGQGMQDADVLDVTQDVLLSVAASIHRFEHRGDRCGSFRSWLFTIVRARASDHWRRQQRHPQGSGDSLAQQLLSQLPSDKQDLEARWNHEYLQGLFHVAATRVKGDFQESTWQAFWRTTVDQEPLRTVAKDLGISLAGVSMAKRRVLQRIQQQIEFIEGEAR